MVLRNFKRHSKGEKRVLGKQPPFSQAALSPACLASFSANKAFLFSLWSLLQLEWNQRIHATFQKLQPEFSHLVVPHASSLTFPELLL